MYQIKINDILSRLDRVKELGHNKWMARCPAHADTDPSLSIRLVDNGKILLHCFSGCPVYDVVSAIGFELCDLMGDQPTHHKLNPVAHQQRPNHVPLVKDLPTPESYYKAVLSIAKTDALKHVQSSPKDLSLIQEAMDYLNAMNRPLSNEQRESLLEFEAKRQRGEILTREEKKAERTLWLKKHRNGRYRR